MAITANGKLFLNSHIKYKGVWIKCLTSQANEKQKFYCPMLDPYNEIYFEHKYQAKRLINKLMEKNKWKK